MINILLAGVGGQGTVLASKLIAYGAIRKGLNVRTTETIGMAQRGGSVVSHVRIGSEIYSPLIPRLKADAIIAFEPAEAVRCVSYLKPDGIMIVCKRPITPVTNPNYNGEEMLVFLQQNINNLMFYDPKNLSNMKTLNIAMLGILLKKDILPFNIQDMKDIIKEKLPSSFIQMNLEALEDVQ